MIYRDIEQARIEADLNTREIGGVWTVRPYQDDRGDWWRVCQATEAEAEAVRDYVAALDNEGVYSVSHRHYIASSELHPGFQEAAASFLRVRAKTKGY